MTDRSPAIVVVLTTYPDSATASEVARAVVAGGLAACVNLIPGVRSIYDWQGTLHDDQEVLAIAKTTPDRLVRLTDRIRELHPYELPEVIALPVVGGNPAYMAWVAQLR